MRFPKRVPQHIKESDSFRILQNCAPPEWMIREVSGRDYGIDCYIELVPPSGSVTGHLLSAQLKWVQGIDWIARGDGGPETYTCSGIETSTAAYWLGLQPPVFLLLADGTSQEVYWADVKPQLRAHFTLLDSQETMSFVLERRNELNTAPGLRRFYLEYLFARRHERFAEHLRDLVVHAGHYRQFMEDHTYQDFHLEVDLHDKVELEHLYSVLRSVTEQLGVEWDQVPLATRFKEDAQAWPVARGAIHEATMTVTLRDLAPRFSDTLRRATELVVEQEADYWRVFDPSLLDICLRYRWSPPPAPVV